MYNNIIICQSNRPQPQKKGVPIKPLTPPSIYQQKNEKAAIIDPKTRIENKVNSVFENLQNNGLNYRESQHIMGKNILDFLFNNINCIQEAGVGTGKTYGYLIPIFHKYYYNNSSFIIATSTIALQDQLVSDIKELQKLTGIDIPYLVVKGKNNYICPERLASYTNERFTSYNSIDEMDKVNNNEYFKIWDKVCIDNCRFDNCPYYYDCQYYELRENLKYFSGIVITNHNLLIENQKRILNNEGSIIKHCDHIIIDEAHNYESKVKDTYTETYNIKDLFKVCTDLSKILRIDLNELVKIVINFNNYFLRDINNFLNNSISDEINKDITEEKSIETIPIFINEDIKKISAILYDEFSKLLNIVRKKSYYDVYKETEAAINFLAKVKDNNSIFWGSKDKKHVNISCCPKNMSNIINKLLGDSNYAFVSATLSTGNNNYSYFIDNLGLDPVDLNTHEELPSPFDYDNNALCYFANNIENPRKDKEKYLIDLIINIKKLINLTKGRTLILFTSKEDMEYCYSKLQDQIEGINMYVQNDSIAQDKLKKHFKNDISSVLFATGSFWEGIDIKGETLSSVIIARLPFPVVDPYIMNKADKYKEQEENVYIKEMLIKLKQGVGRLIRCETDKGIVSILDPRVKKYEHYIKNVLPMQNITYNYDDVVDFVNKKILSEEGASLKLVKKD